MSQQKSPNRASSAEAMIRAAQNVRAGELKPPRHVKLRRQDKPFFRAITRARARDEWLDVDLVVAAQLARCQADIETETLVLEEEGSTLKNERGTVVMNPRFTVLSQLATREMALMRALRMSGRAAGDPRDVAGVRALERRAEQAERELKEERTGSEEKDPLLA